MRTFKTILPDWSGELILENLKDLEFLRLIQPLSLSFRDITSEKGLSLIQNKLTGKGERLIQYIVK